MSLELKHTRQMPKVFQQFSAQSQEVVIPRHFQQPTIDSYDGHPFKIQPSKLRCSKAKQMMN